MLSNLGVDNISSDRFQRSERAGLVCTHQPAISDYVSSENGGQTAFHCCGVGALKRQRVEGEESRNATHKSNRFNASSLQRVQSTFDDGVGRRNRGAREFLSPF